MQKKITMDSQIIQTLANAISTATVLSCLFLKVPQIINLRKKRSAEGIYIQAMLMEITGFTIVTLYNYTNCYSVMTYLEYPIILLQVYVLLYYVLKFRQHLSAPIVSIGTLLYVAAILGFVYGIITKEVLSYLMPFCTPLSGSAKVTYIYGIIKAENADAVSRTTWIISMLTNLARLFTVYVDSADYNLMINFMISTFLSSCVLSTTIYYQTYYKCKKSGQIGKSHAHQHED